MVTDLSVKQVWYNKGLLSFFFREQSITTLEELLNRSSMSWDDTLDKINENEVCLDDFEEDCYELSVGDLADLYDVDLKEDL